MPIDTIRRRYLSGELSMAEVLAALRDYFGGQGLGPSEASGAASDFLDTLNQERAQGGRGEEPGAPMPDTPPAPGLPTRFPSNIGGIPGVGLDFDPNQAVGGAQTITGLLGGRTPFQDVQEQLTATSPGRGAQFDQFLATRPFGRVSPIVQRGLESRLDPLESQFQLQGAFSQFSPETVGSLGGEAGSSFADFLKGTPPSFGPDDWKKSFKIATDLLKMEGLTGLQADAAESLASDALAQRAITSYYRSGTMSPLFRNTIGRQVGRDINAFRARDVSTNAFAAFQDPTSAYFGFDRR